MAREPSTPEMEIDEVVDGSSDREIVYEEYELLDGDDETEQAAKEMQDETRGEPEASTLVEADVKPKLTEKAMATNSGLEKREKDIAAKTEELLKITERQFTELDLKKQRGFDEVQREALKILQDYDISKAPTREEVQLLKAIITSQYIGIKSLTEEIARQQTEQRTMIEKLMEATNKVLEKEDELKEKLVILAKENVNKEKDGQFECFLCLSTCHPATACAQYPDASTRQERFAIYDRCVCCAKKGHKVEDCPEKETMPCCEKCPGVFHKLYLCPVYATRERTANAILNKTIRGTEQVKPKQQKKGKGAKEAAKEEIKEVESKDRN